MQQLLVLLHIIVCGFLIVLVLMQHGKGADMGAAFGSGGSNTMFGSQGSLPFMMKLTGIVAAIFFTTSLSLSYFVSSKVKAPANSPVSQITAPTVPAEKQKPKGPVTPD